MHAEQQSPHRKNAEGSPTNGETSVTAAEPPPPETFELEAADGFRLAATRYPARGEARAHLLIAGATAVPQGFYRRFARAAQYRAFQVLTLDCRGIGRSAPESLVGFKADFFDWARRDLAAAVEALPGDDLPVYYIGHSFGGHALGLLPNHSRINAAVFCGCGAGWHGWMSRRERLRVLFIWKVLGPVLSRWKGYLPFSLLGLGEDLPLPVYRQWRRWCHYPHYLFDDPELKGIRSEYANVRCPVVAINAIDDAWAPPISRDAFMKGYTGTLWRGINVKPETISARGIGHMGYFRKQAEPLWQAMFDWLKDPGREFRVES